MSTTVKLLGACKEIRLHLCQTGPASKGVRDFIEKHYVELKSSNPKFPVLIRECSGVDPKLWVRFDHGKEKVVSLANLSATDVLSKIKSMQT